jgi:Ca2+-binding EF-hand superfamily protein
MWSVAFLGILFFAMNHGGIPQSVWRIGVHHPSPHLLPVLDRSSMQGSDLTTQVKIPEPEDPWREIAAFYFKVIRVLHVLDADGDLAISPWEMLTAPAALRKLDTNHDGTLSPEECGFSLGRPSERDLDPEFVKRARLRFMRGNPTLAVLDADNDGEISASEINNGPAALKKLDKNGDGILMPNEVIPETAAMRAAIIVLRLDKNGDGKISQTERASDEGEPLRELLDRADRNRDGVTTEEELRNELRLCEERRRQFDSARRAAGVKPKGR